MKTILIAIISMLFVGCSLTASKDEIKKYRSDFINTLNSTSEFHDKAPIKGQAIYNHSVVSLDYDEFRKKIISTLFANYNIHKTNPGKPFTIYKKYGLKSASETLDFVTEDNFNIICVIGIENSSGFGKMQYIDCVKKKFSNH